MKKFMSFCFLAYASLSIAGHGHGGHHGHGQNGGFIDDDIRDYDILGETRLLDYKKYSDAGPDADRDVENLPGHNCGYERIRLQVVNHAARFTRVKVVFGNGEHYFLPILDSTYERGQISRSFNLPNKDSGDKNRCIDKVVVVGETLTWKKSNDFEDQAKIKIYGIQ